MFYLEKAAALKLLNAEHDIAPHADRIALHEADDMPPDGLFIGPNWHSLEGVLGLIFNGSMLAIATLVV